MEPRECPNWITAFEQFTENTESPILYKTWTAVTVIAAMLQRKCSLRWGHDMIYPNMYIVLVGPPGCRKGTAIGPGMLFLKETGIHMAADSITREALIETLAKECVDSTIHPKTGKPIHHNSLTIIAPEWSVFLGHDNRALLDALVDWFDCRDPWRYSTKNKGKNFIAGIWVNMLGATTPEMLQSMLPRQAIGGGLTSRIIFVYAEKKGKIVPVPIITFEESLLREKMSRDLERIMMMCGEFTPTNDYMQLYIDWYTDQHTKPAVESPLFAGYCERRALHLHKMCMIHSAACGDDFLLKEADFRWAANLLEVTEVLMPKTLAGVGKNLNAGVMQNIMATIALEKEVNYKKLLTLFYNDVTRDELAEIIQTLVRIDYCKVIARARSGEERTDGKAHEKTDDVIVVYLPEANGAQDR